MEGAVELAEEIFHMPVRLGVPQDVMGLSDIVTNPIYATGVGLLRYGMKHQLDSNFGRHGSQPDLGVLERMKSFFRGNF